MYIPWPSAKKGEGLRRDCFYYGLIPSLRDMLSFVMADLPEREQADTSFDTLYHLAKKLEACHQPHNTTKGGTFTHNPHKGYKKYSTPVGHAATVEADLFPPDPKPVESAPPKPDNLEGLPWGCHKPWITTRSRNINVSCVGTQDTSQGIVHIAKPSAHGTRNIFNSLGVGQKNRMPTPKNNPSNEQPGSLLTQRWPHPWKQPRTRWVGLEMLVDVMLEGCEVMHTMYPNFGPYLLEIVWSL